MIAQLRGKIVEKYDSSIIIDVNGVGYEVLVSSLDYDDALLEKDVKFYTYHHVREQSEELFGFSSLSAKKVFMLLITVQGVGPKAAMAILSIADIESVRSAIAGSDASFIAKANGVGKKTAERITLDLHDKVGLPNVVPKINNQAVAKEDDALEALMALGYSLSDASKALSDIDPNLSTEERVTRALKGN